MQRSVEAVGQLVGQEPPEPGLGAHAVAHDREVPGLEPTDPEERRALRLQSARVRDDPDESLLHPPVRRDEGILSELGDEPGVVELHGPGGSEQRAVAAVGLDAIEAVRRDRHAGSREVAALPRERLPLLRGEPLQLIDGPGPLRFLRERSTPLAHQLRPPRAPLPHARRALATQVLEIRLDRETVNGATDLHREPGVAVRERSRSDSIERLEDRSMGAGRRVDLGGEPPEQGALRLAPLHEIEPRPS